MNRTASGCFISAFIALSAIAATDAETGRRDPFQPVFAASCAQSQVMRRWQLKGVIGVGQTWVGWLAEAENRWRRLTPGTVIPPGNWQVSHLDKSGATLTAVDRNERCDGAPAEISMASPFIKKTPGAFFNVACDGPQGDGQEACHKKTPGAFFNVACDGPKGDGQEACHQKTDAH
ncbi:HofP DNA utilization family protein [Brenneria sp. g21c3]|uniref:HofP DNA utilization family protein n=1 Tax=Brenneria sp. g21c3 TaxID=3093893 RepID=UPI002EB7B5E5|nr:HofP DNA utilization family protein [Brenneria sp. g21c3]